MTQQELDALKALAEASVNASATRDEARHVSFLTDAEEEFLSAAENAVPALVAEVERLTARVAELEIALEAEEFARERRMDNLDPA